MSKYKNKQEAIDAGEDWYGIMPISDKGFKELREMHDNIEPYLPKIEDIDCELIEHTLGMDTPSFIDQMKCYQEQYNISLLELRKGNEINIPNHLLPLKPNEYLVPCTCVCHKPNKKGNKPKHITACCYNGWKIEKRKV